MKNEMTTGRKGKTNKRWQEINWERVYKTVAEIQDALTKIKFSKDPAAVHVIYELQTRLINSFAARALAVRRVVTSSGARIAGVDGVLWDSPAKRL